MQWSRVENLTTVALHRVTQVRIVKKSIEIIGVSEQVSMLLLDKECVPADTGDKTVSLFFTQSRQCKRRTADIISAPVPDDLDVRRNGWVVLYNDQPGGILFLNRARCDNPSRRHRC